MSTPFNITQVLYVSKSYINEQSIRGIALPIKAVGEDSKIVLAAGDGQTILEQFKMYEDALDEILNLLANKGNCESSLSVCIRAYDFIPEIYFPRELLAKIAKIGASIDLDVLNMIE